MGQPSSLYVCLRPMYSKNKSPDESFHLLSTVISINSLVKISSEMITKSTINNIFFDVYFLYRGAIELNSNAPLV